MKLYAVLFVTYLKHLILSTIRSYHTNYTGYKIRGVPLQWFKSYLESRAQYVEVENVKSNPLFIQYGVPQGSTLGPLLFLIYINNMPNRLEKANIRTFADDTTLFYSSNSPQDLKKSINEEFNHLLNYCSANKLSVNFKKIHHMTISSPQKQLNLSLMYAILKKRTTSNT